MKWLKERRQKRSRRRKEREEERRDKEAIPKVKSFLSSLSLHVADFLLCKDQNCDVSAVQLSKEQLLSMSSSEYEDFVRKVTSVRALSFVEEEKVAWQRR